MIPRITPLEFIDPRPPFDPFPPIDPSISQGPEARKLRQIAVCVLTEGYIKSIIANNYPPFDSGRQSRRRENKALSDWKTDLHKADPYPLLYNQLLPHPLYDTIKHVCKKALWILDDPQKDEPDAKLKALLEEPQLIIYPSKLNHKRPFLPKD